MTRSLLVGTYVLWSTLCLPDGVHAQALDVDSVQPLGTKSLTIVEGFETAPDIEGQYAFGKVKAKGGFLLMSPKSTFGAMLEMEPFATLELRVRLPKLDDATPEALSAFTFATRLNRESHDRLSFVFRRKRNGDAVEGTVSLEFMRRRVDRKPGPENEDIVYARTTHDDVDLSGARLQNWKFTYCHGLAELYLDDTLVLRGYRPTDGMLRGIRIDNDHGLLACDYIKLTGERRETPKSEHAALNKRDRAQFAYAQQARAKRDFKRAFIADQERLKIARAVFGRESFVALSREAESLRDLESLGRHQECVKHWPGTLARFKAMFGERHPLTILVEFDFAFALVEIGREDEALELMAKGIRVLEEDFEDAVADGVMLARYRGLLQEASGRVATSASEGENYSAALKRYELSLAQSIQVAGKDSWPARQAQEMVNYFKRFSHAQGEELSILHEIEKLRKEIDSKRMQGDIDNIVDLIERAAKLMVKTLGSQDPTTLDMLRILGRHYYEHGNEQQQAKAMLVLEGVRDGYEKLYGREHPKYYGTLHGIALQLVQSHDQPAKALELFHECYDFYKKYRDDGHLSSQPWGNFNFLTARAAAALGTEYYSAGKLAKAEKYFLEAIHTFSDDNNRYSASERRTALDGLSVVEQVKHSLSETEIRNTWRLAGFNKTPERDAYLDYISLTGTIASVLGEKQTSLTVMPIIAKYCVKSSFNRGHPLWAWSTHRRALLDWSDGELARAQAQLEATLQNHLGSRIDIAGDLSTIDSVFLAYAYYKPAIDDYLSLPIDKTSYVHVVPWKNLRFGIQSAYRAGSSHARTKKTLDQLDSVTSEFSAGYARGWNKYPTQLEKLLLKRHELQRVLMKIDSASASSTGELVVDAMRNNLPPDTVFVDYFVYDHCTNPWLEKQDRVIRPRLCAFVVRGHQPTARLDLGDLAALGSAYQDWTRAVARQLTDPAADSGVRAAGEKIRSIVWDPLIPYLADVKTFVYAPDAVVNLVPIGALPTLTKDNFLIDEYQISIAPSATWFAREFFAGSIRRPAENSLLLIGDIDYNRAELDSAGTRRIAKYFQPLSGTQSLLAEIEQEYHRANPGGKLTNLSGQKASEQTVRSSISDKRFVHFDTHGFWLADVDANAKPPTETVPPIFERDPAQLLSFPEMQSGIALAGANRAGRRKGGHDGILWSAESSTLDLLGTELVVLAACSSGTADSFRSEGMFSVQRGMHAAGARTVVSTLWSVSNDATLALMREFYENLWRKKQSRIQALQNAKRTVRDRFDVTTGKLRDAGSEGPRAPIWFWAPFVLSGDWHGFLPDAG